MKSQWLVILIYILFFGFLDGSLSGAETEGTSAVLEKPIFDFHEVNQGDVINHEFRLSNRGHQVLRIKKVTSPG